MKQKALFNQYETPERFLIDYNPGLQVKLIRADIPLSEIALNGKIPSLGLLRSTFGETTPVEWLKIQFGSLNDYAEQGKGFTSEQLNEMCMLFLSEYYYLNAAEVCLFIARLKLGKYGQFYGAIGPMKIMSSCMEYIKERRQSIEVHEREAERKKREDEINKRNGTVSYARYLELKALAENGDEESIEKLKSKK